MTSECARIADQLTRAFTGDPWHGPPLRDLLSDITADQALSRPLPSAHTIWELVVHIDMYVNAAYDAIHGTPMPRWYGTEADWPAITFNTAPAWQEVRDNLFRNAERLAQAIERFTDARLTDTVPGREYDFYYMLHGIVQHSIYHAGQIAVLKRAASKA
jgi:uncharacterized damage-inducible protein DinB